MAKLRLYVLLVDILLGVGAFAALFNSSFGPAEKFFFGSAFLLVMFAIEIHSLQSDTARENQFEGVFEALKAMEKRMDGGSETISGAIERYLKSLKIEQIASGEGYPYAVLITLRFGGWVVGGWLGNAFLLSRL